MSATVAIPVFKPDVIFKIDEIMEAERATIVHCTYHHTGRIRIWPCTFLIQEDGSRKKLLQAFGIAAYPHWKMAYSGHRFTLVFEGLDENCHVFDLLEEIPERGEFHVRDIRRNSTDVYHVSLNRRNGYFG